jgi:hypothetical protein
MHCNYSYISAREQLENTAAKMASSYEKEPIFVLECTWDDKTKMPRSTSSRALPVRQKSISAAEH